MAYLFSIKNKDFIKECCFCNSKNDKIDFNITKFKNYYIARCKICKCPSDGLLINLKDFIVENK